MIGAVSDVVERDPWYACWFGEEYLALYPERDDEEAEMQGRFALDVLSPFARLGQLGFLDLACGTGRHAVVLSEDVVNRVVGLDLSFALLAAALGRTQRPCPGYLRSDMRRLPFHASIFGAVVNFFTSFGYFEDPGDDLGVLSEIARVLVPGGAFLSDVFNGERVLATLVSREEKTIAGEKVSIRRRYDPSTRRIEKEIEMGRGAARRLFNERVRVYCEDELRELHRQAGFTVSRLFGDFDGCPFDRKRSPRLILLAVKPEEGSRA
jgi:SAM-dependent methyltransferase